MIVAAIAIGSNSVRMLLCEVEGQKAKRLGRDREGTRLFAGLKENRNLSDEAMAKTVAAVARMAKEARAAGAEKVHLFATSATRDAGNQAVFADKLQQDANVQLQIVSGYDEAVLSYLGAAQPGSCGVIDIGGGSTELIVGHETDVLCAFSCQMGAVRLFQQVPITGHGDVDAVKTIAGDILQEAMRNHPTLHLPEKWVGTGGTFTTLGAMVKGIHWTEKTYLHGTRIRYEDAAHFARYLADMPLEERTKCPGLQPNRADIVVHGICILLAAMERLHIPAITVSEYGNLDGWMRKTYGITEWSL